MSWSMYICPTDLYFNIIFILKFVYLFYCVVLENVYTHPKEIIGNKVLIKIGISIGMGWGDLCFINT